MRISRTWSSAVLVLAGACAGGGGGGGAGDGTTPFPLPPFDAANFVAGVDNPFMPLVPGTRLSYEKSTDEGLEEVVVEVLSSTRTILGVVCVEVRDVVSLDGEVVEDTIDWFAQDVDGHVWYFGEDSKTYEGGVLVGTEGSWEAGVAGALPGIVMLADPEVGLTYEQERAPGVAEDRATVRGLSEGVTVPYGAFSGCLRTEDFTPLEPGVVEDKYYAPGVGFVLEVDEDGERLELVDVQ
jgi:hypothetical protein